MQNHIPILLAPAEAKVLRTLSAKISGYIGGSARGGNKARSSRRNIKRAIKARKTSLVAA